MPIEKAAREYIIYAKLGFLGSFRKRVESIGFLFSCCQFVAGEDALLDFGFSWFPSG